MTRDQIEARVLATLDLGLPEYGGPPSVGKFERAQIRMMAAVNEALQSCIRDGAHPHLVEWMRKAFNDRIYSGATDAEKSLMRKFLS